MQSFNFKGLRRSPILLFLLVLISCGREMGGKAPLDDGTKLSEESINKVLRVGLTMKEVESLIGNDYVMESDGADKIMCYSFVKTDETLDVNDLMGLYVVLENGRVKEWIPESYGGRVPAAPLQKY